MARSSSSRRWLKEHRTDPFVQRAKAEGYRSRAVFKLMDLDRRYGVLRPGAVVLDLGAAPGGWSQWAATRVGPRGRVYAVDLLPIHGADRVTIVQGDLREPEFRHALQGLVGAAGADAVLSDLAPNLSGIPVVDQARAVELAELALELAVACLRRGGSLLVKVFQGESLDAYVESVRRAFADVERRKPGASRPHSRELYVLARGFGGV